MRHLDADSFIQVELLTLIIRFFLESDTHPEDPYSNLPSNYSTIIIQAAATVSPSLLSSVPIIRPRDSQEPRVSSTKPTARRVLIHTILHSAAILASQLYAVTLPFLVAIRRRRCCCPNRIVLHRVNLVRNVY